MRKHFLNQPIKACSSIFSIGERGGGKTFLMLKCLNHWMENDVFFEIHLILPDFEDEQNDSYKWLSEFKQKNTKLFIYESYHASIGKKILEDSQKYFDPKNFKQGMPERRWGLFIDDATGMGKSLMRCEYLCKLSTSARHKRCHSWFIMHYTAGIIPPKVREQIGFIFIYDIHKVLLQTIYKQYINFPLDFENFKDFNHYFMTEVTNKDHGCLLIDKTNKPKSYSPWVNIWFNDN